MFLFLTGCAQNSYKQFYQSYNASSFIHLKDGSKPSIIKSANLDRDVRAALEEGYIAIGESLFNGSIEDYENAVIQAESIGSSLVVVSRKFASEKTINTSMIVPTTTTTYHSGSVYSSGSIGSYNGTSTSYGSQVIPMSSTQYRYDQTAIFLAKPLVKPKIGLYMRDLNEQDKSRSGANVGVLVDIVVKGAPAYEANLVSGDVILSISGEEVVDKRRAIDVINKLPSYTEIPLVISRAGAKKKIMLTTN